MSNKIQQKFKDLFETTVESDLRYEGSVENIDFYSLLCKCAAKDAMYKIMKTSFCMLNCTYDNQDAVLLVFAVPVNSDSWTKDVADRLMEIIRQLENCFTVLDYINSKEIKDEKFIYLTVVKKI